jgi:alpha-beta hydrolase superfamily lysophospholipase
MLVAGLAAFVRWLEPRFAFFPIHGETATPAALDVRFAAATVATVDGEQLRAWQLHAPAPRALIVYFHGNGGNLSVWAPILSDIARHGYEVIAFDYRGYGLSTGRPSERGLYRDVDAVVAHAARARTPSLPLVFWGRSLGTAMAAYASTLVRPDRLVLEAGFPDARSLVQSSPPLALLALFSSYPFRPRNTRTTAARPPSSCMARPMG